MKNRTVRPNPLTDPIIPAVRSTALVTAASTGLFSAVADGNRGIEQLAQATGLHPDALQRLARVLVASGYLSRVDDGYQLTEVSRTALVEGGSFQLTNWIAFCRVQLRALAHLENALLEGRRIDLYDLMTGEAELLTHQRAMAETAGPIADWIAASTPVPSAAAAMLDVGGSHGVYSAAICGHNPHLACDVLELPSTIDAARAVSKEYATDRFVTHIKGDIITTPLEKEYDVVFLGNIIHHLPDHSAGDVLAKIAASMVPGGTLVIWDLAEDSAETQNASEERDHDGVDEVAACFSLFFYLISGAKCYSELEIRNLLQTSGFNDIRAIHPPDASTHTLYTARRR